MSKKQVLSDSSIMQCLKTHYGIEASTLSRLPIGADLNALIYKAQTLDQTTYFIKIKLGHHHDISIEIVELLERSKVKQIIPPIKTLHGKPTQALDDFTLIVYPFIEGQDGFSRPLTESQWINLGKALKQVHEVKVPLSMQNRIRKETYSQKWRNALQSIYPHIEAKVKTDEIGLKLQKFMRKNLPAIKHLVDRAQELGERLRSQSPQFMLCHSDIHAGNVLIAGNEEIYIVDWDEPIMAPKERDLMFIGGGVGNVWNQPQQEKFFYQGYGKTEVDLTILAYYRHERIVEDIAIYSQELLLSTAGGQERPEIYKHFIDMFEPSGVVEIAFKTEKGLFNF